MTAADPALIEVAGVVKEYRGHTALRGIDLSVAEGEFLCLLGPSGCGKTTLLRSIAGLEAIDGGRISVRGEVLSEPGRTVPAERRNLGMVFQSYALWPHMTVFGNVAYALKTKSWPKARIPERVAEVLDMVGLGGLQDRFAAQLSGGQMQRVALARSLAPEPSVLLFDEPLSNLDAKLRERMRFELRAIQRRVGITAVYVTHDQAEAMVVADRIVLLKDGDVHQSGSAAELYEWPASAFAADFMGSTNIVEADVVAPASGEAGFRWPDGRVVTGQLPDRLRDATRVITSIRPEHVAVHAVRPTDPPGGTVLDAELEDLVYLGNLAEGYLRVGTTRLRAQLAAERAAELKAGMPVWAVLENKWVRAVDGAEQGD
ncbi:ABC transporter ATP-binding protein [Pseudonocardia acaciae]|uniref:ABC transporter ATP-binding protein n=1 Tax=Pseudonocardia acaciae TaxID=551276 RepID=UPI000568C357|nr:ABC transporter ATP-binding protein [Pseudonocardia acaciae]